MATIESRHSADGQASYRVKVRLKGHPVQYASFPRLTDARRWAQSVEAAIREGRHFKTNESKRHTVADAIARYIEEVMPQKRGSASQIFQLAWWQGEIGAYTLADITPALISKCREKLLRDPIPAKNLCETNRSEVRLRKPATVVRYLAVLSHLFSIAMKEWQWCEDNPLRKVRKPKEPRGRERYLSDAERTKLLDACRQSNSADLYTVVVLALSTGMRRGEIMSLRWGQIDFEQRRITLYMTKNGEQRAVPLVSHAYDLVSARSKVRRIDNDMLFPGKTPGTPVELKKSWATALATASIANFRFHDLRHSAASYLAMNGASLIEIAAVLGHKTLQMVKRYSHLSDEHTQRVVSSMNEKIFSHE